MPPSFLGAEDETEVGTILVCVGIVLAVPVDGENNGGFRHPGEIFLVERFLPFPRLRLGHKLPEIPVFLASLAKAEIMLPADGNDPGIASGIDIHAFYFAPGIALRRELVKIPVTILTVLPRADINLALRCKPHRPGSPSPGKGSGDRIPGVRLGVKHPEVVQLFRCMRKPAVLPQPEIELVAGSEKHRSFPCPARERDCVYPGWKLLPGVLDISVKKAVKLVEGRVPGRHGFGMIVGGVGVIVDIISVVTSCAAFYVERNINISDKVYFFPCSLRQWVLLDVKAFVFVASSEEDAANERYV